MCSFTGPFLCLQLATSSLVGEPNPFYRHYNGCYEIWNFVFTHVYHWAKITNGVDLWLTRILLNLLKTPLPSAPVGDMRHLFLWLYFTTEQSACFPHRQEDLVFLAAALWFASELLICLLLIEITVGSARPVTVRSWHSGTQPEWILQSSKSACQEIGHKGNNCQLNQIAWSKLDKFC